MEFLARHLWLPSDLVNEGALFLSDLRERRIREGYGFLQNTISEYSFWLNRIVDYHALRLSRKLTRWLIRNGLQNILIKRSTWGMWRAYRRQAHDIDVLLGLDKVYQEFEDLRQREI